jgi:hypothetical protein
LFATVANAAESIVPRYRANPEEWMVSRNLRPQPMLFIDIAGYTIEGNSTIVTSPIFGGAKGEVKGKNLVFPTVISKGLFDVSEVANSLQGTWAKQR